MILVTRVRRIRRRARRRASWGRGGTGLDMTRDCGDMDTREDGGIDEARIGWLNRLQQEIPACVRSSQTRRTSVYVYALYERFRSRRRKLLRKRWLCHPRSISVPGEARLERRHVPFADVVAGGNFESASIPDIFCGMYVTPTTWKEISGSRASKRPGTEGGTTLCPWYGTVSWRTRPGGRVCARVCSIEGEEEEKKNTGNSKVSFVRWYPRLSVSSNRSSCSPFVSGACVQGHLCESGSRDIVERCDNLAEK